MFAVPRPSPGIVPARLHGCTAAGAADAYGANRKERRVVQGGVLLANRQLHRAVGKGKGDPKGAGNMRQGSAAEGAKGVLAWEGGRTSHGTKPKQLDNICPGGPRPRRQARVPAPSVPRGAAGSRPYHSPHSTCMKAILETFRRIPRCWARTRTRPSCGPSCTLSCSCPFQHIFLHDFNQGTYFYSCVYVAVTTE